MKKADFPRVGGVEGEKFPVTRGNDACFLEVKENFPSRKFFPYTPGNLSNYWDSIW
jgi:hypothetical protein